jgi:hypothetical protein
MGKRWGLAYEGQEKTEDGGEMENALVLVESTVGLRIVSFFENHGWRGVVKISEKRRHKEAVRLDF